MQIGNCEIASLLSFHEYVVVGFDGKSLHLLPLQVFEGVYNNARMLHFLTAVVVSYLAF